MTSDAEVIYTYKPRLWAGVFVAAGLSFACLALVLFAIKPEPSVFFGLGAAASRGLVFGMAGLFGYGALQGLLGIKYACSADMMLRLSPTMLEVPKFGWSGGSENILLSSLRRIQPFKRGQQRGLALWHDAGKTEIMRVYFHDKSGFDDIGARLKRLSEA